MGKIRDWIEIRIGIDDLRTQIKEFKVPRNISIFQTLGFVALAAYLIQVFSGIFLMIYYVPHTEHAFKSVQNIMTRVPYGWLFRQMHIAGSNLMVATVFLHLFSAFFMGSYKRPREMTWITGCMMLTAVLAFCLSGYLLSWNQLSYWATTIVTTMPTALPVIGDFVTRLLRGGDHVSGITLTRFFALHVALLPPLILLLMALHIFLISRTGISAPPFGGLSETEGTLRAYRRETHPDGYPCCPYLVLRGLSMTAVYLALMFFIIAFLPTLFLPGDTNSPANPFKTPVHVRPEWYFLAPYQMLKLIPNKFLGISIELILVGIIFLWPFFDTKKERDILKRPLLLSVFIFSVVLWAVLTIWGRY